MTQRAARNRDSLVFRLRGDVWRLFVCLPIGAMVSLAIAVLIAVAAPPQSDAIETAIVPHENAGWFVRVGTGRGYMQIRSSVRETHGYRSWRSNLETAGRPHHSDDAIESLIDNASRRLRPDAWTVAEARRSVPDWSVVHREPESYHYDQSIVREDAVGWPVLCFRSSSVERYLDAVQFGLEPGISEARGGIVWKSTDRSKDRVIPFHPIMVGLLFNSILFGTSVFLVITVARHTVIWARASRSRCVRCGYPISELGCPECGWRRPPAEGAGSTIRPTAPNHESVRPSNMSDSSTEAT